MSLLLAQVLKQLGVKHNQSSTYQSGTKPGGTRTVSPDLVTTLESILCRNVTGLGGGFPWLMLATREVSQESTEFSPIKLEFGHTAHGPLAVLQGDLKASEPDQNYQK